MYKIIYLPTCQEVICNYNCGYTEAYLNNLIKTCYFHTYFKGIFVSHRATPECRLPNHLFEVLDV